MEISLFNKYKNVVQKRDEEKEKVIEIVNKETSVVLKSEDFTIDNKKIVLNVSSIKKSHLFKKGIDEILKKEGYRI